jgi:hypothetical protein
MGRNAEAPLGHVSKITQNRELTTPSITKTTPVVNVTASIYIGSLADYFKSKVNPLNAGVVDRT